MSLESTSLTSLILDIPISCLGFDAALDTCSRRAKKREGGYVCFANVHTVTEAQSMDGLNHALSNATYAFADGMPLVWVSKLSSRPIGSRVCGPDFMAEFLRRHPELDYGFIGGSEGLATLLARRYSPNALTYSPPMRPFSVENALEDWRKLLHPGARVPQVVWVGLGAPKQELWMREVHRIAPETLFFGVGAAFDFLSNTKTRAPIWMQRLGLEWFYRLLQEPRRLWKRYFETNSKFLFLLLKRLCPRK